MKRLQKIYVVIITVMLMLVSTGCMPDTQETSSEKKIKQSFNQSLAMYPVKNLEDFYDKEGYRDEEFDKNDKGMWVLISKMAIMKKKRMVLKSKVWFYV